MIEKEQIMELIRSQLNIRKAWQGYTGPGEEKLKEVDRQFTDVIRHLSKILKESQEDNKESQK